MGPELHPLYTSMVLGDWEHMSVRQRLLVVFQQDGGGAVDDSEELVLGLRARERERLWGKVLRAGEREVGGGVLELR